jgi:hypothetical protein
MKKLLILTSIVLASCGSGSSADTSSADHVYLAVGNGVPACRISDIETNIADVRSSLSEWLSGISVDNFNVEKLSDIKLSMHSLDFQYYENGNVIGYARLDNSRLDMYVDALMEDVSYWSIYKNDFSKSQFSLAQMTVSANALISQVELFDQDYRSLCSTVGFDTELVPIDG